MASRFRQLRPMRSGRHFRAADDSDPEVAALLCSLIGSTAAWGLDTDAYQQLCRQVLERDGWRCQGCGSYIPCALSASITWECTASRRRAVFSSPSDFVSYCFLALLGYYPQHGRVFKVLGALRDHHPLSCCMGSNFDGSIEAVRYGTACWDRPRRRYARACHQLLRSRQRPWQLDRCSLP